MSSCEMLIASSPASMVVAVRAESFGGGEEVKCFDGARGRGEVAGCDRYDVGVGDAGIVDDCDFWRG